jgi:hypothetical protein
VSVWPLPPLAASCSDTTEAEGLQNDDRGARSQRHPLIGGNMYIGVGAIVLIIVIVLIVLFLRGRSL